jgi:hypothetical protein
VRSGACSFLSVPVDISEVRKVCAGMGGGRL